MRADDRIGSCTRSSGVGYASGPTGTTSVSVSVSYTCRVGEHIPPFTPERLSEQQAIQLYDRAGTPLILVSSEASLSANRSSRLAAVSSPMSALCPLSSLLRIHSPFPPDLTSLYSHPPTPTAHSPLPPAPSRSRPTSPHRVIRHSAFCLSSTCPVYLVLSLSLFSFSLLGREILSESLPRPYFTLVYHIYLQASLHRLSQTLSTACHSNLRLPHSQPRRHIDSYFLSCSATSCLLPSVTPPSHTTFCCSP